MKMTLILIASAVWVLADDPSPQEVYWHQQQELREQAARSEAFQERQQRATDDYLRQMRQYCPQFYPQFYPVYCTDEE